MSQPTIEVRLSGNEKIISKRESMKDSEMLMNKLKYKYKQTSQNTNRILSAFDERKRLKSSDFHYEGQVGILILEI